MILHFVLSDSDLATEHLLHTGEPMAVKRRGVDIQLTQQQLDQLNLQEIGFVTNRHIKETIESISVRLPEQEASSEMEPTTKQEARG